MSNDTRIVYLGDGRAVYFVGPLAETVASVNLDLESAEAAVSAIERAPITPKAPPETWRRRGKKRGRR